MANLQTPATEGGLRVPGSKSPTNPFLPGTAAARKSVGMEILAGLLGSMQNVENPNSSFSGRRVIVRLRNGKDENSAIVPLPETLDQLKKDCVSALGMAAVKMPKLYLSSPDLKILGEIKDITTVRDDDMILVDVGVKTPSPRKYDNVNTGYRSERRDLWDDAPFPLAQPQSTRQPRMGMTMDHFDDDFSPPRDASPAARHGIPAPNLPSSLGSPFNKISPIKPSRLSQPISPISQPISQAIPSAQPTSQPVSQPTSQPVHPPKSQPIQPSQEITSTPRKSVRSSPQKISPRKSSPRKIVRKTVLRPTTNKEFFHGMEPQDPAALKVVVTKPDKLCLLYIRYNLNLIEVVVPVGAKLGDVVSHVRAKLGLKKSQQHRLVAFPTWDEMDPSTSLEDQNGLLYEEDATITQGKKEVTKKIKKARVLIEA